MLVSSSEAFMCVLVLAWHSHEVEWILGLLDCRD